MVVGESRAVSRALLEAGRPVVVGRAAVRVVVTGERRRRVRRQRQLITRRQRGDGARHGAHRRAQAVEIRVRRRVGDDVGDRHAELLVHLVGHRVALSELPAGRMSADDDGREIRKEVLPGELAQQVVGDVERCRRGTGTPGSPGRPPPAASASPVCFTRGERIAATAAIIGGEARRDDDRALQRSRQERGGQRMAVVVVRITPGAMDEDEGAGDRRVRPRQRV